MVKHAVILAIGSPRHHSQITYNRTHAMLPALGKPLFIRIMDRLYRVGIREYTVIVGEGEGAVVSYLNSQWMPDVKINLMFRFAADTLAKLFKEISQKTNAPYLVCNYNSFTHTHFPERILKTHAESPDDLIMSGAPATLSASQRHFYVIHESGKVVEIAETPRGKQETLTLTDFYVCGQKVIEHFCNLTNENSPAQNNRQFVDLATDFLQSAGQAIVAQSTWILQVEADRDLLTLSKHLLDEGQDAHILSELPYTVKIIPPVRIDPQVSVGQGCKIGPHVYLERGCSVGHNVVLKQSIVLERANVPSEKALINTILTTRGPIT